MSDKIFKPQNDNSSAKLSITSIVLWGVSVSPYVRKVMIALAEKNLTYQQREILPKSLLQATGQQIPEEFDKISPLGKIPVLQVNNIAIAESSIITAYLDKKFPDTKKLYPDNPEEYARVLWFEHYSDYVLSEVIYKKIFLECVIKPKIFNQLPDYAIVENAKQELLPGMLDYLNQSIANSDWISGNHFSAGDIAISTQLLALEMAGFTIDEKRWPHLYRYFQKVLARKSYQVIKVQS